jgi:hypothetical protein
MKVLSLSSAIFAVFASACASTPSAKPAQPVETTSADIHSREDFTPPDQWEMKIADRPEAEPKKDDLPVHGGQADKTAAKRQQGLITLPSKPATPAIAPADRGQ